MANLWRVRIFALPEETPMAPPHLIYEADNITSAFQNIFDDDTQVLTLRATVDIHPSCAPYLNDAGAKQHATSVWFEDVVGHVSTPDMISFGDS
jgi:hypothetical protein